MVGNYSNVDFTVTIAKDAGYTTDVQSSTVHGALTTSIAIPKGGTYFWKLKAIVTSGDNLNEETTTGNFTFTMTLANPSLTNPINGKTVVSILPTCSWGSVAGAAYYKLYIDDIDGWGTPPLYAVNQGMNTSKIFVATDSNFPLTNDVKYYWKVAAVDNNGVEYGSTTRHFTTHPEVPVYLSWPYEGASLAPGSIKFSWYTSAGTNGQMFQLQVIPDPGSAPDENDWALATVYADQNTVTKTISGLSGGKTYYWRVIVKSTTDGVIDYSDVSSFTTTGGNTIYVTASWPVGTTETTLRPTFYWYADQYLNGIKYQINIVKGGNGVTNPVTGLITDGVVHRKIPDVDANILSQGLTGLSHKLSIANQLEVGQTYWWQVRVYDPTGRGGVYDAEGYSVWSSPLNFETYGTLASLTIPTPTYPIDVDVYSNSPTLYWYYGGSTTGITYDLEIRGINGTSDPASTNYNDLTTLSKRVTGLTNGGQYHWRVLAKSDAATGISSDWQEFSVIGGTASDAVASWPLDGTVYTNNPTLYWFLEGSSLGVSGYYVKYCYFDHTTAGNWRDVPLTDVPNELYGTKEITSPLTTSWTINVAELIYGETYYWAVVTKENENVEASYSTGTFTVVGGAASATPILLQPANDSWVSGTSVTLSWLVDGSTAGITNYEIKYIDSDDESVLESQTALTTTQQLKTITGLTRGHTYYWKVRSYYNPTTHSDWSEISHFSITPGSMPVQPLVGSPNDVKINTTSPTLSWVVPFPSTNLKYDVVVADNPLFSNSQTFSNIDKPSLQVNGLTETKSYFWKVRALDGNGNATSYSGTGQFVVNTTTKVEDKEVIPTKFNLSQNYPNPFNPSTTIRFALPETSPVIVKIFNILGKEVKTLVNENMQAGNHLVVWAGDDESGRTLPSGTYIYKITAGNNSMNRKMVLLK